MSMTIRPAAPGDAAECGRILHEAFRDLAERHSFPPDFPYPSVAAQFALSLIQRPGVYSLIAESDGRIVGCCFRSELDAIHSIGPVALDPAYQGRGIGRMLMEAALTGERDSANVRLLQDAFNTATLGLYAAFGFEVKEFLAVVSGEIAGEIIAGIEVRGMEDADLEACAALCRSVHGFDRTRELRLRSPLFPSYVAVRDGRIVAYASAPHFWPLNSGVAQAPEDMKALLLGVAAESEEPLAFLLPLRQAELFRWCLQKGMRVIKPMTLMARGLYQEPQGCFLPSSAY